MHQREPSQLHMFQLDPRCVKCGGMTTLACAESAQETEQETEREAEHDLRTFACRACGTTAVIKVSSEPENTNARSARPIGTSGIST